MPRIDESIPFLPVRIAIVTVSDTRTEADDTSGDRLQDMIEMDGHHIAKRAIVKDDRKTIVRELRALVRDPEVDVVITTGGTGVTGRDVTPEALGEVMDKEIEGFGELFRWISFEKVGTSTMQSRAIGGVADGTYIFALPGSPSACKDGWMEILRFQLDSRHRPCNLVELMPRLKEHLEG
jgi:molybdenum cofactor biosynthesis protein B